LKNEFSCIPSFCNFGIFVSSSLKFWYNETVNASRLGFFLLEKSLLMF
jgi:hypothetical protein